MIRTQVYIPNNLYEQAKLRVKRGDITFSELLREGLRKAMQENQQKKQNNPLRQMVGKFIGRKSAGAALQHNDIYAV